jgi:hypothetical protein
MATILSFRGIGAEGVADPDGWFDFSFGDEPPAGWDPSADALDLGFGDEPMGMASPVLVVPLAPAVTGTTVLPDDGGCVVTLSGDFSTWPTYKVRIQNSFTAETYPLTPLPGCLSVVPGEGYEIVPMPNLQALRFALPAMPPAVYDILVSFGPNYAESMLPVAKAIRVIRRHFSLEQYTLRRLPDIWYGTGPRVLQSEPKLGGV